jgi:carbonic anhydrase/acetyltransferase-like protein (isoleucine patch superfamily)
MKRLEQLIQRIIYRVNINLRQYGFDVAPYIRETVPLNHLLKFYAFYGVTSHHPLHFHFSKSNIAGSYFLGKCKVDNSVLYKTDVRGDELKAKGDIFHFKGVDITLDNDQVIWVKDSFLIKTLVHNFSHDPENLELFLIKNSVSTPYANIHGAPVEGCFLGAFSTVDLTTLHDCVVGRFAYVQVGELIHDWIDPGRIWIKVADSFDFDYRFPEPVLDRYIRYEPGKGPQGIFMDFVEPRKVDFQKVFDAFHLKGPKVPPGASVSRYAVVRPKISIGENVLVAQRAYLENSSLGTGANAQENCYIIDSQLEGCNVMAHGAKLIHTTLGRNVFVGFNSFLHGRPEAPLTVGRESIVMPHTIIDLEQPVEIPAGHLVWGHIRNPADLASHSLALDEFAKIDGERSIGAMRFKGKGAAFVDAFQSRIEHILEANGAYFDGRSHRGHAQKGQNIAFNIIQPYPMGQLKGLYPTVDIHP